MFRTIIQISESELTPPYNHVHHADICRLLERGRVAMLDHLGYPYQKLLDQQLLLVLTRLEIDFLRELRAGEVAVTCEEPTVDGKSLWLNQRILLIFPGGREKIAVKARIELKFMSGETHHGIEPPPWFAPLFLSI